MKKILTLTTLLATSALLVACDMGDNDDMVQNQQQTTQQSSTAAIETTNEIDGTYVLEEMGETKTLTITDGMGTLETMEKDGEKDSEQVTVDGANKVIVIGDDSKTYMLEGSTLTLKEDDGETAVYTKQ
ncbi:hypothetical protein D3X11_06625 [Streptococcus sp. X16XC17]|uniref:hypothetical protein n=1 Tax=unclassified Streptococcus TaxID=2608887 RepID=UPI00066FF3BB|nr:MULTISPECIES: hypothetical protein [unclassified Streptococcus]TCD45869.1 hypothetical protein D3X11_06625 [Streptococcus sp. X16XC17]